MAQFKAKAEAICTQYSARFPRPSSSDSAVLVQAAQKSASIQRQMAASLGGVATPGELRSTYAEWLSLLNQIATTEARIATAFDTGNMSYELADELTAVTSSADSLAYSLGLGSCAIQG